MKIWTPWLPNTSDNIDCIPIGAEVEFDIKGTLEPKVFEHWGSPVPDSSLAQSVADRFRIRMCAHPDVFDVIKPFDLSEQKPAAKALGAPQPINWAKAMAENDADGYSKLVRRRDGKRMRIHSINSPFVYLGLHQPIIFESEDGDAGNCAVDGSVFADPGEDATDLVKIFIERTVWIGLESGFYPKLGYPNDSDLKDSTWFIQIRQKDASEPAIEVFSKTDLVTDGRFFNLDGTPMGSRD